MSFQSHYRKKWSIWYLLSIDRSLSTVFCRRYVSIFHIIISSVFFQIIDFLKNYVANFNIGRGTGGTQVAVIGARSSPEPYIALNQSTDLATLQMLIGSNIHNNTTSVVSADLNGFAMMMMMMICCYVLFILFRTLYEVITRTLSTQYGRRIQTPAIVVVMLGSNLYII